MRKAIDARVAQEVIGQVKEINVALAQLKRYLDKNFKVQIADIHLYYTDAKLLFDNLSRIEIFFHAPKHLNKIGIKCSKTCIRHFDEIINNLQFHDIFKQKLDHIMDINEEILSELSVNGESKASLPYTSMIGVIKSMSISQIALIEKEYFRAFEKIKDHLAGVKKEMQEVTDVMLDDHGKASAISDKQLIEFTAHLEKWQKLSNEIKQKVEEIEAETAFASKTKALQALLEEFLVRHGPDYKESADREEKIKVISSINKRFTMESERELLRSAMQKAGYKNVLDHENAKGQQHGGIDLF